MNLRFGRKQWKQEQLYYGRKDTERHYIKLHEVFQSLLKWSGEYVLWSMIGNTELFH